MVKNIFRTIGAVALSSTLTVLPNTSYASYPTDTGGCAALDGTVFNFGDGVQMMEMSDGDVVTFTDTTNDGRGITASISMGSIDYTPALGANTILVSGGGELRIGYDTGLPIFAMGSAVTPSVVADPPITINCTSGGIGPTSGASGATQTSSMSASVGANAQARLNTGGSNSFLPTNLFVSSGNVTADNPEWNAWVAGEVHNFSGGLDGNGFDLNFGIDKLISDSAILGFTIGIEDLDFGATTVRSVAYGPYYARSFENGSIFDFMLTYAEPDYGAGVEGERWSVAANWTGAEIQTAAGLLQPFLNVSAFDEDINNGTSVDERRVIAGGKYTFFGNGSLNPYVRGAFDYKRVSNSSTGSDSFLHPLLGIGLSGQVGAGSLSTELLYRKYSSDTRNISASFRLDVPF